MRQNNVFIFIILFFAVSASSLWAQTATINADTTNQSIRGFGASSAWHTAAYTNTTNSGPESILFWNYNSTQVNGGVTSASGIGLSMLRCRIPPDNPTTGASTSGSDITDTGEIAVMKQAKGMGVSQIWATEWSVPAVWKSNDSLDNGGTIETADYGNYAKYLLDYVNYCQGQGITLMCISAQNEPDQDVSYESGIWTGQVFHDFISQSEGAEFAGNATKIMMPEPSKNDLLTGGCTADGDATCSLGDAAAATYISYIGTHLYGSGPLAFADTQENAPTGVTREYWETEMMDYDDVNGNGGASDDSMADGLATALLIHNSMVSASMNAYHFWWLECENSNTNQGLVDYGGTTVPQRTWCMGNFSRFVRPGYYRMGGTITGNGGVSISAYKDNSGTPVTFVIVAINFNNATSSQTFNLTGINTTSVTPWVTDSNSNLVLQQAVSVTGGSFTYSMPVSSVVSFIGINNSSSTNSPTPSNTATHSPTNTATKTSTSTATTTATPTRTSSPTTTATSTATSSATPTATLTKTNTPLNTGTSTATSTATPTRTNSPTNTATGTATSSATSTASFTKTNTPTLSPTETATSSPSATETLTATHSPTQTATSSATNSTTFTPSATKTETATLSATETATSSASSTGTATATHSPTNSPTSSPTSTATTTTTNSFTSTMTSTATISPTGTQSPTDTFTSTNSPTNSPTSSPTLTFTSTATDSPTATPTLTSTHSPTSTATLTSSPSATLTATSSATSSVTSTQTETATSTLTLSPSPTSSATSTATSTSTSENSYTPTSSPTNSATNSPTATSTTTPTPTATNSLTNTTTNTFTMTPTSSATSTDTLTDTATLTNTPSSTDTSTPTNSNTLTNTATSSPTQTWTSTLTPTFTATPSATFTRTSTPTSTFTFTASFTSSPTKTPTHTPTAEATVIIYPNPAKWPGPVKVQISLPSYAGQVEIELFTIAFRKVNELVLFNLHEGINTINIPLTDREGTPLANGVYYVVVQTPNGRFISKLLVLN